MGPLHDNATCTVAIFLIAIAGTIIASLVFAHIIEWIFRRFVK